MYRLFVLSIAVLFGCNAFSQQNSNNWVFGDSVGLNFSTPIPTFYKTSILSHEASASISDSLGNLLFYTNGQKVWDRNNEVMPNGDSLNIGKLSFDDPSSITQGVTVLPKPGSNTMYYIFQLQAENGPPDNYGLEYSIVEMTLNGGQGDVVSKNKDVFTGYLDEKMHAVKHANGRDWWLTTMLSSANDTTLCLATFLITPDTILGPFTQCFTGLPDLGPPGAGSTGQMKFSQDGSKLAFTRNSYVLLFDFNRCSGTFSSMKSIFHEVGSYGCEFSNDNRMLYVTWPSEGILYQYCISCPEPIEDSRIMIYSNTYENYQLGALQIARDEKIYVPLFQENYAHYEYSFANQNISVINNPSNEGLSCNFDTLTIPLGDARCTATLPNMPNYNLGPLAGSECDTLQIAVKDILPNETFLIYPNPASDNIYFKFSDNNLSLANINSITITDITGHLVKNITQIQNNGIYIGDLVSGMYFVNITGLNNQSTIEKLFIEN